MDLKSVFALVGGLALFIFGMLQLGEGLQKAAGEKMRRFLQLLTGNPILGVLVGALVTVILQSSSATTVMVIGFVSAGLMTLPQALGVIFGANIGTTVTAWIVSFKVDEYAWIFVAVGFVTMFFFKKEKVKHIGQVMLAFGILFVGLNTMGAALKPLGQSQAFKELLLSIKDVPVLGLIAGTLTTVAVQSSSASIGLLQSLSRVAIDGDGTPLVSLYQAIPILLGSNIGTTITAVLASIGAKRNAKRAALAHTIFNVTGSLICMLFLVPFTRLVEKILLLVGNTMLPDSASGVSDMMTPMAEDMMTGIAISHTTFNVANTLIWIPLIPIMVILIRFFIRGEDPADLRVVRFLDYKIIGNPVVAIDLANQEITRMTDLALQMLTRAREMLLANDLLMATEIDEMEETLDFLENETVKYLSTIFASAAVTEAASTRVAAMMHATNDIERIGDYACNVIGAVRHMQQNKLVFSEDALGELDEAFQRIEQMVRESSQALHGSDPVLAGMVISQEDEIDRLEDRLRTRHLERLNAGLCDPQATVIFLELIHIVERVSDHCKNLAEVAASGSHYKVHRIEEVSRG
ncbi:MAG: Na/Pi cotransporter family protein [Clostridiaceae bacterium]|nr:Na/Pi cotransporter family protein [Clostridiaceae bacterium]